MNLMFEQSIRQSKPVPDFSGSAAHEVRLTLHGTVTNPKFVRFLEQIGQEKMAAFGTHDLLVLDYLQRDAKIPEYLRPRLPHLAELDVVERLVEAAERATFSPANFTSISVEGHVHPQTWIRSGDQQGPASETHHR